jgi:hypothetical protein
MTEIYRDNKRLLETIDMKILEALPTFRKLMGNTKNPRFVVIFTIIQHNLDSWNY